MQTLQSSDSGGQSAPLTKDARDKLVAGVNEVQLKLRAAVRANSPPAERSQLLAQKREFLDQYYAQLPVHVFGRCPICNRLLEHSFDPWGLDGFWWQESLSGRCHKPKACEHYRVLTGALSLNGRPPLGGEAEAHPGPGVPYVIPKVLELPTMVAVISSIPMHNGYTAYPIPYFSSDPPPKPALANPWRMTSCNFTAANGQPAFTYKTDPWDFALLPWAMKGKIQWIEPGDGQNLLKSGGSGMFPYGDLQGVRLRQVIQNDKLLTKPAPNKEVFDPFSG